MLIAALNSPAFGFGPLQALALDNVVAEVVGPQRVAEPASLVLLGAGLIGFAARRWRRSA